MTNKNIEKRPDDGKSANLQEVSAIYMPRVDIIEGKDAVNIIADMPGIEADNVDIDLDRNVLTLRGKYKLSAPERFQRTYSEYESGGYERVFTLSNEIDRDGIKATVNNGVLRLVLPKAKQVQPRKIAVNAG